MNNFNYTVNSYSIDFEIPGYFDVDLVYEWIIWGDYDNEYPKVQHKSIVDYINKHFGHLYSDKGNTLNALQGFRIEADPYYDVDNEKLTVELNIELINDLEDEYLEDCDTVINRIVNSINIDEESWNEVQEEQFDWWLENGVSGEDENMARKMIDYGFVFDYEANGEYNHQCVSIDTVDQSVVDRFVQEQIDMMLLDQSEIDDLREAVEDAGFSFNYVPKKQAA
jgi:phage pi2 protein 07